jgi:phage terminase large subunit-like protein
MVVFWMPEAPPAGVSDPDAFRYWKPEAQQRALDLLKEREANPYRPFYCANPLCDGRPHGTWDFFHARKDQRPPKWSAEWLYWLLSGGRGSGKTRTGAEVTHKASIYVPRIILIAPTGPDLRETMVEGMSGLLATAPPDKRPVWEPSKKKLTWPNGCIAQGFSAEEPDRLRGPQSGFIWADEPAFYPDTAAVWNNMLFGFRVKNHKGFKAKIVATTTPLPTKWMRELIADPLTVTHRVSSYANIDNLDEVYRKVIIPKYEGTRLGRQELHGELLEDVEGALWQWGMFQWVEEAPHLVRIVVAVDPAGTANKKSDLTGIIVLGIDATGHIYVLADYSGRYSPGQWADKAVEAHEEFNADAIVAEKNYGGDMVRHTLENSKTRVAISPRIILVESRRGKALRAEPIVALYEKKRVTHVGERGDLNDLQDEQTTWIPGTGDSPNRVDALVHGATELAKIVMPSMIADPRILTRQYRSPTNRHLRAV